MVFSFSSNFLSYGVYENRTFTTSDDMMALKGQELKWEKKGEKEKAMDISEAMRHYRKHFC
ncbi:MAG TPA: hypothetical protein PLL26_03795 [Candidatus Dojkabacteria bacterium]|nr:hypothetical protein [Candidatus Dojkabacteria bacterium]